MIEIQEIKVRKEFQEKYGKRLANIEAIAQSHGYPPDLGESLLDWILQLIHKQNR